MAMLVRTTFPRAIKASRGTGGGSFACESSGHAQPRDRGGLPPPASFLPQPFRELAGIIAIVRSSHDRNIVFGRRAEVVANPSEKVRDPVGNRVTQLLPI
jgi:hypothetical protein